MINIKRLKQFGFFDMNINNQIKFLKQHKFFNLSNQDKINFLESTGLFYLDINDDPPNKIGRASCRERVSASV